MVAQMTDIGSSFLRIPVSRTEEVAFEDTTPINEKLMGRPYNWSCRSLVTKAAMGG